MTLYRYLLGFFVAFLFSTMSVAALPLAPYATNQVEFFSHQPAAVAEHSNGIVVHGQETHVASLGFGVGLDAPKGGLGANPFKGKTPEQIDKMFKAKNFEIRGSDPISGKGGYVNPKTGRSYHIDPEARKWKAGTEYPHVDVNRLKGSDLPKRKYPLGDKLTENE